jgi:hypothetical protein
MVHQKLFLHYRMVLKTLTALITAGMAAMVGYLLLQVRL